MAVSLLLDCIKRERLGSGAVRVAVVGGVSWPLAARSRMRAAKKT
jgi:hypothetical protein